MFAVGPKAHATGAGITYHGRLIDPNGNPVVSSNVQFRLQIRTPGNENCLMYEEVQNKDLSSTSGTYAVTINDGTGSRLDSTGYTLDQIFANRNSFTFAGSNCTGGTTYSPNAADSRKIQVLFNDGTFPIGQWEPMAPMAINFVPMAIESMQVGGYKKEQLLKVADGVSTTGTELNSASWTELLALIGGTTTQYVKSGSANFTSAPQWNGTPSGANDLVNKTYVDAQVAAGLPNVGTPGTYTKVTTDTKGRVTTGTSLVEADLPTISTAGKVSGSAINAGTIVGTAAINSSGNLVTTGTVQGATVSATNLRVYNGGSYVQLAAPSLAGNLNFTLPAADGLAGHLMKTNGAGQLSFVALISSDIPSLDVGKITTGTLPVGRGGTGQITYGNNSVLITNGTGSGFSSLNCTLGQVIKFDASGFAGCGTDIAGGGSQWTTTGSDIYFNTGKVGVGTATPATVLEVGGEVKIGNTSLTCGVSVRGSIRYNSGSSLMEFCDGSTWRVLASTTTSGCTGPNAFSFTNINNAALGSVITSNAITPAGCAIPLSVTASGSGNPEVSINGGTWTNNTLINPGDSLRVRAYTTSAVNTPYSAVISIGSTTGTTWTVTTKAGNTRIFMGPGHNGNFGGLAGANAFCQTAANTAGYGGLWKAILSDNISSAADRLLITYPVVKAAGGASFAGTNLWGGTPDTALTGSGLVWTATDANGAKLSSLGTCQNWTSSSNLDSAPYGQASYGNSQWMYYSPPLSCNNILYVYCLEQPDPGCSPSGFSFSNVSNAAVSTLITSNSVVPTGCGATSLAIVSGEGSPQLSINGGAWVKSGTLNPGDSISVRLTTKPGYNQINMVRLEIGNIETLWTVTNTNLGSTRIFRTAASYNGNMGGLAGADALCQTAAGTAGYSGTWKALLSSSTVNAKDRVTLVYPILRASDGIVVSSTNLWGGSLNAAIEPNGGTYDTFTATVSNGVKVGNTYCDDWTNGSGGYGSESTANSYSTTAGWINSGVNTNCGSVRSIYCVSQ